MVALVRGGETAYRNALIVLVVGAVTSGIQTFVSQSVRGSSAPVNMRFAVTVFTLIVFLIFRIPSIWRRMMFDTRAERWDGEDRRRRGVSPSRGC